MTTSDDQREAPVHPVTDASARETFIYGQLAVRGLDTNAIGTPLTIALNRAWDEYLAALSSRPALPAGDEAVDAILRDLDAFNVAGAIGYAVYSQLHDDVAALASRPSSPQATDERGKLIAEVREYEDALQGGEGENWMRLVDLASRLAAALDSDGKGQ